MSIQLGLNSCILYHKCLRKSSKRRKARTYAKTLSYFVRHQTHSFLEVLYSIPSCFGDSPELKLSSGTFRGIRPWFSISAIVCSWPGGISRPPSLSLATAVTPLKSLRSSVSDASCLWFETRRQQGTSLFHSQLLKSGRMAGTQATIWTTQISILERC